MIKPDGFMCCFFVRIDDFLCFYEDCCSLSDLPLLMVVTPTQALFLYVLGHNICVRADDCHISFLDISCIWNFGPN